MRMAGQERRLNLDPRGGPLYVLVDRGKPNPGSEHRKDGSIRPSVPASENGRTESHGAKPKR